MEPEIEMTYEVYQSLINDQPRGTAVEPQSSGHSPLWKVPGMRAPERLSGHTERYLAQEFLQIAASLTSVLEKTSQAAGTLNDMRAELQGPRLESTAKSVGLPDEIEKLQKACRGALTRIGANLGTLRQKLEDVTKAPTFSRENYLGDEAARQTAKLTYHLQRIEALDYLNSLEPGERIVELENSCAAGDYRLLWAAKSSWKPLIDTENLERAAIASGHRALPEVSGHIANLQETESVAMEVAAQCWQATKHAARLNSHLENYIPDINTFATDAAPAPGLKWGRV